MKTTPIRKESRSRTKQRGSILVICMVLAGLGTIGVAAWLSLLDARGHLAEEEFEAVNRKVRYQNGKALVHNLIYTNYLSTTDTPDTPETYSLPDGWGTVTIEAFATAPLVDNATVRFNKTGSTPFRAYSTDIDVGINDGTFNHPWQFQLKSYNPVLGGELLSIHTNSETASEAPVVSGDLNIDGRAVFWNTDYQNTVSNINADNYQIGSVSEPSLAFNDNSGSTVLPSNFPFAKQTVGNSSYDGKSDVIDSSPNAHNAYFQKVIARGGYVNLGGPLHFADGDGLPTLPGGDSDDGLITAILDSAITNVLLTVQLIANSPLSSRVMTAALERATPLTEAQLLNVLDQNYPLPDDVVTTIVDADYTAISPEGKEVINDTNNTFLISDGAGRVMIDLSTPSLPHVLLSDVTSLEIRGQLDGITANSYKDLAPRVIAVSNSDNVLLREVTMSDFNRRQLILAISNKDVLDNSDLIDEAGNSIAPATNHTIFNMVGDTPFSDWRMIGEFEGIMADFDSSFISGCTIIGGIRANHTVRVTGGTINIDPEHEFENLESLLSRNAWIEAFKQ